MDENHWVYRAITGAVYDGKPPIQIQMKGWILSRPQRQLLVFVRRL
ncbi:MAG TPA: hypothetical protein VIP70_10560 [Nitrososphaeraceae archaeon]